MKIAILGAGGNIAKHIAQEALNRGHSVVGVVRDASAVRSDNERLTFVQGDAADASSIASTTRGADAIVMAVSPRPSPAGRAATSLADAARAVIAGAKAGGVKRLVVVGGASSLEVAPGVRLFDTPNFPAAYKAEALSGIESFEVYRTASGDLDWTYISPAAEIGPGSRTAKFRVGDDALLVDEHGRSFISFDDYAKAVVDELEQPTHHRARMTVAY